MPIASCSELDPFCARCSDVNPTMCAECAVPGWQPAPETGECRPVGCLQHPYCQTCDDDANGACLECDAGFSWNPTSWKCEQDAAQPPSKPDRGHPHKSKTCRDLDRHCQYCASKRPQVCHKCRRGYRKDRLTGRCRRANLVRRRMVWRRVWRKINGKWRFVWRPIPLALVRRWAANH